MEGSLENFAPLQRAILGPGRTLGTPQTVDGRLRLPLLRQSFEAHRKAAHLYELVKATNVAGRWTWNRYLTYQLGYPSAISFLDCLERHTCGP